MGLLGEVLLEGLAPLHLLLDEDDLYARLPEITRDYTAVHHALVHSVAQRHIKLLVSMGWYLSVINF